MKTFPLGRTGVDVSALCLGAMYFGTRMDEETSFDLLDQYVKAGGSFIDTANIYAHWQSDAFKGGESERMLGSWMKARGNRKDLFIASKVGFDMPGVPRGLSASLIEAECNKSLTRLGVDTIDLYYAHVDDYETPIEETLEAFNRLVQTGKVRFIGASNFLAWRLEASRCVSQAHGLPEYCCIQQRYTYLRPAPGASFAAQVAANDDLLDYVAHRDITLLAYSALLNGSYTRSDREIPGQYRGADSDARLVMLNTVAREQNITPNQVILAWMLHHGVVPVMAASTTAQMHENLGALSVHLDDHQIERLDTAMAH